MARTIMIGTYTRIFVRDITARTRQHDVDDGTSGGDSLEGYFREMFRILVGVRRAWSRLTVTAELPSFVDQVMAFDYANPHI